MAPALRQDPSDHVALAALEKSFEILENLNAFLDFLEETYRRHAHRKPLLGLMKRVRREMEGEMTKEPK